MQIEGEKDGRALARDYVENSVKKYMPLLISSLQGEPRVKRKVLMNAYLLKYYKEHAVPESEGYGYKDAKCEEAQHAMLEVQSIIQSCIDDDNKYIDTVKDNQSLIFLTKNGKSFADPLRIGLLNACLRELGLTRTVVVGVALGIAGWNWKPILDAVLKFLHV